MINRLKPPQTVVEAITLFEKSRLSDSVDDIFNCLVRLNPKKLEKDILISLVSFVERMASTYSLSTPHINIFGTGGDKTINISTITAIVASQSVCVVKIGTKAVTSKWGSSEFIAGLEIQNKQKQFKKEKPLIGFKPPSKFISLSDLGFSYGDDLRLARRMLKDEEIPDIYKTIFPSANLSGYMGRVTGYYHKEYFDILTYIAKCLEHNALLVHSKSNIDEIMPGEVTLTHIIKKEVNNIEIQVPGDTKKLMDFFTETDDLQGHIDKYQQMISNEKHFAWEVIAYNVASCLFVRNRGVGDFKLYLDQANNLILNLCQSYANF